MDSPPGLLSERARGSSCCEGFTVAVTILLLGHVLFLPPFLKWRSGTLPLDTHLLNTVYSTTSVPGPQYPLNGCSHI